MGQSERNGKCVGWRWGGFCFAIEFNGGRGFNRGVSTKPVSPGNRDLAVLLLALVCLVVAFHVALAARGYGRFRDQHLGVALHYAATQIDLKHTVIPGFNANDTPTIQELPVWQAAAGLAFKLFGTWWGWANAVSLVLFLNCLYPLFRIAQMFYGDRVAWWTPVIFLSQGLVFAFAGEAGTDGFSLAVTVWFWFACCRLVNEPVKWFLPAVGLGVLAATAKLPFFMATGLGALFLLLKVRGFKLRELAALAGVGVVVGLLFLAWNHYTETLQAGAEFPFVDLRLKNPDMMFWYFGDWHYRLSPAIWVKSGWRFANDVFGSFTLIALFVGAVASRRVHPAAKFYLAGAALTTLVFSHLVLHHHHYYLMFTPAVAMLLATAVVGVEKILAERGVKPLVATGALAAVILAGLLQGLMAYKVLSLDPFPKAITATLRDHTAPTDKLLVINGGWGGDALMRADRRGLSLWDAAPFEDAAKFTRLKELGYNKLVIVSESPFQNAIQIINPGQTGMPRVMAKSYLTPRVEAWPTVFASDDLIIKDIP